jgi:hypothetical protein
MLRRITLRFVFILIFLCFLSSLNLYGQAPTPTKHSNKPQNQTTSRQTQAEIISESTQSPTPMIPLSVAPNAQIEPSDKTKKENNKSSADWWLVYFTAALVAVVFLQFIWMIRQEKWMRRNVKIANEAADAAKKSADALPAIERAYLFVKIKMYNPEPEGIAGTIDDTPQFNTDNVKVIVTNRGKTAALLTGIPYKIKVMGNAIIDVVLTEFTYYCGSAIPSGTSIIESKEEVTLTADFFMTKPEWRQITMGESFLTCLGCIHYEDVFGNPHRTVFCWKYEQFSGFHPDKDPKRNERT